MDFIAVKNMNNNQILINLVKIRDELNQIVSKVRYLSSEIDYNVSTLINNLSYNTGGVVNSYSCCNKKWSITKDSPCNSLCPVCNKLTEPCETVTYVE